MSNKTYDIIKFVALIVLPLFTTFVGAVLGALDIPGSAVILTIMTAFETFVGGVVKAASDYYNRTHV